MKKWKQRLSTALIVAMTAGVFSGQTLAAEKHWELTEGGWQYTLNGELMRNYMVTEVRGGEEHNYYIKDDSYMASNELFLHEQKMDNGQIKTDVGFAQPDGEVMKHKWIILQADESGVDLGNISGDPSGLRVTANASNERADWYFFDDSMFMVRNRTGDNPKKINGDYFRFDGDGKMLHDMFETYEVNQKEVKQYHMHDGYRAENKWLYIEDGKDNSLEGWYFFEKNGDCRMATSSDATLKFDGYEVDEKGRLVSDLQPAHLVEGLTVKGGNERKVAVGESITLTFEAELATGSNAKSSGLTKNHEFWFEKNIDNPNVRDGAVSASFSRSDDDSSKECYVKFTSMAPGKVTLVMHVDGVQSEDVVITVVAEASKSKDEAIKAALDDPESITDVNAAKDTLVELYGKDSGESDAETIKELKKTFVERVDDVAVLENKYAMANKINQDHDFEGAEELFDTSEVSVVGASLNGEENSTVSLVMKKPEEGGTDHVSLEVNDEEGNTLQITGRVDLDISFYVNDQEQKELSLPLVITVPIPAGLTPDNLWLFHTTDDGVTEPVDIVIKGGKVTFAADQFSIYSFVNTVNPENSEQPENPTKPVISGGSSSGGSSSGKGSSAGMTRDAKKGYMDSVKGIITGSGDGYSSWVSETGADGQILWWLKYADGSYAAGSMMTREDGTTYEQVAWEKVNGSWYAFGADGYAKSGWVYDEALGGRFYIDIQTGMKTGWAQIDGKWYYFNPVSDGRMGIMVTNTTIDGYVIGADGVWVEA